MENKVLDKNIAHIAQYSDVLSDKILMTNIEKSNICLSMNNNNEYNLIFNDTKIYSDINIQSEVVKIAKNNENSSNSLIIIYGLGLGYLPDEISKRCPDSKIIIYEPNLELIKFVLSIAEIDALYKNNVFLSSSREDFFNIVSNIVNSPVNLSICFLNSYKNLYYDDIVSLFDETKNFVTKIVGNINTHRKQMFRATYCTIANINNIKQGTLIESIQDIYKNKTAIILCAGPSLEENIELIKDNQDKFVIFALSPTLQLLKRNSIIPDFIVNIDVIDNSKQFKDIDMTKSYFINEAFTEYKVAALPCKKRFFYISENNFFNYWLRKCLKIENNLQTFGTSSYTAFQSAVLMGFSKIILMGQDLAYKDGKCYAKGSQYDCLECKLNEKTNEYEFTADIEALKNARGIFKGEKVNLDKWAKNYLKKLNQNIRTVKDIKGNLIPTKADYLEFIRTFEDCALNINNIELINSSNGANIKGFKNIPLGEAIKGLPIVEKLDLTSCNTQYDFKNLKYELKVLLEKMREISSKASDFISIAQKLLKEVELKKVITDNTTKLIEKYNSSFDELAKALDDETMNDIFSESIYNIYDTLKSDYFSDIEILKSSLNKIISAFHFIRQQADLCIYFINTVKL